MGWAKINMGVYRVAFALTILVIILLPYHAFLSVWVGSALGIYRIAELWKEVLILVILCMLLMAIPRRQLLAYAQQNKLILTLITAYVALVLASGVVTYRNSLIDAKTLAFAIIINIRFLVFFITTQLLFSFSVYALKWFKIFLIPAMPVVVFGLLQEYFFPAKFLELFGYSKTTILPFQYVNNQPGLLRVQSFLRGANPLGAYLTIILTALSYKLIHSYKSNSRILWGLAFVLGTVVLFYTYSRSAWIGFALSIVALCILHFGRGVRRYKTQILFIGLFVTVLCCAVVMNLHNIIVQNVFFHSNSTSISSETSNGLRAAFINQGISKLQHHPFGMGLGTVGPASVGNSRQASFIPENYYLQIALEIGVQGLILFAIIQGLIACYLWQRRANGLATTLLASLVGITCINMVSHAWADDTLSLMWWGLAGIALRVTPAMLPDADQPNEGVNNHLGAVRGHLL